MSGMWYNNGGSIDVMGTRLPYGANHPNMIALRQTTDIMSQTGGVMDWARGLEQRAYENGRHTKSPGYQARMNGSGGGNSGGMMAQMDPQQMQMLFAAFQQFLSQGGGNMRQYAA